VIRGHAAAVCNNPILASQDPLAGMFTQFVPMKPGHFKTHWKPLD
jgi:hypothetical protein